MSDETTGVPTKHQLPPMRLRDWVYGLLAMTVTIGVTCGLWYGAVWVIKWVASLF